MSALPRRACASPYLHAGAQRQLAPAGLCDSTVKVAPMCGRVSPQRLQLERLHVLSAAQVFITKEGG